MKGAGGAFAVVVGGDAGAVDDPAGVDGVEPFAGVFGDGETTGEAAAEGEAGVGAGVEADVAGAAGVCANAAAARRGAQATAPASKTRILINRNLHGALARPLGHTRRRLSFTKRRLLNSHKGELAAASRQP
jgi:hypothetical protein